MQLRLVCYVSSPAFAARYVSIPSHSAGVEHHIISWSPGFERREFELTLSFALTLQIQRIIAWLFPHRGLSVATVIVHVSAAFSITLLLQVEYIQPLVKSDRLQLVRRMSSIFTCKKHVLVCLSYPLLSNRH